MNIGDRIKEKRLELGMTQEELAEKVGFKARASVSRLEGGDRNIPISKLSKLAEVLDTTIKEYIQRKSNCRECEGLWIDGYIYFQVHLQAIPQG